MKWETISVFLGIVLFLLALRQFRAAYQLSRERGKTGRWVVLAVMVGAFLIGYLGFIQSLMNDQVPADTARLVSAIFLGGSVFVLVCAHLFEATTRSLSESLKENDAQREKLARQAESLSRSVDQKSFKIAEQRTRLVEAANRTHELEKQRLEARMLARQRLEGIALMASGVAHDFNNLLVGILGNASYAKQLGPTEGEEFEEVLTDVEKAADRAAELTQQLTAYCGSDPVELEAIDLSTLSEEMLSLMRSTIDAKVDLETRFQADLPKVWGDSARFRQLLINLISNACQAIVPGTGRLVVRTGTIELDKSGAEIDWLDHGIEPGDYVYLEIEDGGCGMSDEDLFRAFDPFFSTKGLGRGLGLAAVRGIAQSHGGGVRLEKSNLGGIKVATIFPVLAGDLEKSGPGRESLKPQAREGRVLAIDDELIVLDTIRRGLGRAGYRVDTISNQEDFASFLERDERDYSAAVIDIMMPDIVFEDLFEVLRQRFPTMPILISSGYSDLDLHALMMNEEYVTFLTKPYRVQDLLAAIGEVGAIPG